MVFKHKDPGTELTQAEFIAACGDGHIFACQATGDIVYASSATVLSKLAKGSAGTVLSMGCSCIPAWTTNAASATVASTVVVVDGTDASSFVAIFDCATGSMAPKTDAGLAYNAGTGTLTATAFAGPITGNVTGNASGTALTVTQAAQCAITSLGTLTGLTLSGDATLTGAATDVDLIDNNACAISFDAAGQAGILAIDTQNCAEGVKMSGKLTVTGAISTTGAVTVGVDDTGHDVKFFGAAAGAFMIYDQSCDQLEIRGASADATTSTGKLLLSTSLTNVNANDVIGSINFQAPLEAGGTDAITVAAGIRAVAQATFTCAVNATDLIFYTGHSEAATEKFRFTSQNEIGIAGANYGTDGQVLTSGGAGAAAAWEDAGGGAVSAINNATANELVTIGATTTELCAEANLTFDGTGQFAFVNSATCSSTDLKVHSSAGSGATPARLILRTSCGNTADTFISFHGVCTYEYAMGVDNSDSDKFKISGSALGTNDKLIIDSTGAVSMPLQPAVYATGSNDPNNTGAGSESTITFTERFDQNADFNGTTTFTAPVTGRYQFNVSATMGGITCSMTCGNLQLKIANLTQRHHVHAFNSFPPTQQVYTQAINVLADMDASDTATATITISNGGGNTADIENGSTFFSVYLVA
jgi:hypothetical protein